MISLFSDACSATWDFVGYWWFGPQHPDELEPAPTRASTPVVEVTIIDDDDDDDMPPISGDGKPKCVSCGGPNFSLAKSLCIMCRAIG